MREILPSWLCRESGQLLDPCSRGRPGQTRARGEGRRRWLRERRFHDPDGESLPHIYGFDYHDKSIQEARESAKRQGVADRITFEVAKAKEFPGKDYDFVAVFDCLHDMGDPVGAAAHVRAALSEDGSWMIVEPFANDDLQDNLNPVGRVYYSFSTLLCTPCSRSQEVGMCLGAQAGEKQMRKVVTSAGFSRFRRATQTPFNLVYEARP